MGLDVSLTENFYFSFVFIAFFSESLLQRIKDHKIARFSRFQEVVKIIVGGLYYARRALSIEKRSGVDFTNILRNTLRILKTTFVPVDLPYFFGLWI